MKDVEDFCCLLMETQGTSLPAHSLTSKEWQNKIYGEQQRDQKDEERLLLS